MNKPLFFSVTFSLFAFISPFLFAQETKEPINQTFNHEISIVFDDIFAKNTIISGWYASSSVWEHDVTTPKAGIGYKYVLGSSAIRTKFLYGSNSYVEGNNNNDLEQDIQMYSTQVALGYEFRKTMGKAQLFYGIDLLVGYSENFTKTTIEIYDHTDQTKDRITKNRIVTSNYGASPLVGIKYFITPSFSLSTEVKFAIEQYQSEVTRSYNDQPENDYKSEKDGLKTGIGPLGQLSFHFHF